MKDSQGSNNIENNSNFKRKVLYPITSIEQLVNSYYVSKSIYEVRDKIDNSLNKVGIDNLPIIDAKTDNRVNSLYKEACTILRFNEHLVYMVKLAIEDMYSYNFTEDASVSATAQSDTAHLKVYFGNNFTTLSKINLFDHTLNVLEEAINLAKGKGRTTGIAVPLIASLLHDFGKSTGIREKLDGAASSRGIKAHAEVSYSYVNDILISKMLEKFTEIPVDTISLIANCVKSHHPANLKQKVDQSIAFVIEADHSARKKEHARLLLAAS